jgi:hypothetical protein
MSTTHLSQPLLLLLLFFLLFSLISIVRSNSCEGRTSDACTGTCCAGGSDMCYFLPQCIIDGSCLPFRRRLALNLTAAQHVPEAVFAEIMKSHWRTPPELSHLAADIDHLRKRQLAGQCFCAWSAATCCPVDCSASPWSAWSACSVSCNGGSQSRSRTISQPSCGGLPCADSSTSESQQCNTGCCPVDCVLGSWSMWGSCSATCGSGTHTRTRSVSLASCGGACGETSPSTSDSQSCNTGCCPTNCVLGTWGSWSSCSATCDGGSRSRSRSVTLATCGGSCSESSPSPSESQSCSTGCCPRDCQLSTWTSWGSCTASCGIGTRTRTRSVAVSASCGGATCSTALSEAGACDTGVCCPVDCTYGTWTAWSMCSATCGSGIRTRTRSTQTAAQCGGTCNLPLSDSASCTSNGGCCPVDCAYGAWTSWQSSTCSVTCGNGLLTRTRSVTTSESCGGSCAHATSDTRACTQPACSEPAVDCSVSTWSQWSSCSVTCGSGMMSRLRTVSVAAKNGGVPCPTLTDTTSCGVGCCPIACSVSTWSTWSVCSATCGAAVRRRTRQITNDALCGGTPCPTTDVSEACALPACAVDCQLSSWSTWSQCSQACGTGEQRRTRNVLVAPSNGGAACGTDNESQICTQAPCQCTVSAWSAWSSCSLPCGGGTMARSRTVDKSAADCPPLSDSTTCNTQPCARDCQVGAWAEWSACSVTCGGGTRERTRSVTQTPVGTGAACPLDLTQSDECSKAACALAGLPCADYVACSDCVDSAKTNGRCQFCVHNSQQSGVCQSLRAVEFDASSELRACAQEFNLRVTDRTMCPSTVPTATTSASGPTEVTVDVVKALKLAQSETTALGDAMLSGGLRFQVRVTGEEGALLRSLGDGGLGVFSPSRDNSSTTGGHLRSGLAMLFLFPKDRPVSFKRLVLGEWNSSSDSAVLEVHNDEFLQGATTTSAMTSVQSTTDAPASSSTSAMTRKRQFGIVIRAAESAFGDETAAGFTKYVITPGDNADFTVKSFVLVERRDAASTAAPITNDPSAGGLDTTSIALIIVGVLLFIAIVVIAVVCFVRRRRASPQNQNDASPVGSGVFLRDMRPELSNNEVSLPITSTSWASDRPGSSTYQSLELPRVQGYQAVPPSPHLTHDPTYKPMPANAPAPAHYTPMEMHQHQDQQVGKRDSYVPLPGGPQGISPPPYQTMSLVRPAIPNQYTSPRNN